MQFIFWLKLKRVSSNMRGELQLTDTIQWFIDHNSKVYAVQLEPDEIRIEIGEAHS